MVWSRLELVGDLVVCHDVVGTACAAEHVWNQGKTESAGMEGENHIMLDSCAIGSCCGVCDHGIAEGIVSGRRRG